MFESDDELDDAILNDALLFTGKPRTTSTQISDENRNEAKPTMTMLADLFTDQMEQSQSSDKTVDFNTNSDLEQRSHHFFNLNNQNGSAMQDVYSKSVVARKFPGPAGLQSNLPDISVANFSSSCSTVNLCSQASSDMFAQQSWMTMCEDYQCRTQNGFILLPELYNIAWILKAVNLHKFESSRVPFLAAAILFIEITKAKKPYVLLTLRDITGEVKCIMDYDTYMKYALYLQPNSVIVLYNFGILTTFCNNHNYLLLSEQNLIRIYRINESNLDRLHILADTEHNIAVQSIFDGDDSNNKRKVVENHLDSANCSKRDNKHCTIANIFNLEEFDFSMNDDWT